jgi:murein L,D-transpeptidase YcbB/YkuD
LRKIDPDLFPETGDERFDPLAAIERARSAEDIGSYLDSLVPQYDAYQKLRIALAYYQTFLEKKNWPVIGDGVLIRPGMNDSRLEAVRHRLELTEGGGSSAGPPDVYDDHLVAAVKIFQRKYGLEPDGIIGTNTRTAFNLTPSELINVIRANMIRMHIQAHELGDTYVMVNIAGFTADAVRNHKIAMQMPVIVGKLEHQTPVFSDKISYLDFNPYWHIPTSIAMDEELPALIKNPYHLVDQHIRLFANRLDDAIELDSTKVDWHKISRTQMSRYQLRQDPGPWNALGRVKFVFPNHYSVYMHDTPAQDLFLRSKRSFSHGCIRVSRPLALAEFVLNGQDGWDREALERVAAEGKRKIISLRRPVPIYITYQTAWVDITGSIRFNSDIYGRDAKLLQIFATGK